MSPEAWIGLAIGLAGIIIIIAGALVNHIISDIRAQADFESRIKRVEIDIGSHETGIRGELHRQVNLIGRLRSVVYFIGRKLGLDIMNDLDDDK